MEQQSVELTAVELSLVIALRGVDQLRAVVNKKDEIITALQTKVNELLAPPVPTKKEK